MVDPWFEILVSVPQSRVDSQPLDVFSAIGRYDFHPLLVSIPQQTLGKFMEFNENVERTEILFSSPS